MPVLLPTLLFHRDYQAFQGGHLKLADYMAHTAASGLFRPRLYLTPASRRDHPFPPEMLTTEWRPAAADALFIAGMDWQHVPRDLDGRIAVLNLIQHPRHADPDDPRFAYLTRRALRLCVSQAVAEALRGTGRVNGPIHTIPAGIDLARWANDTPLWQRPTPLLIAGLKAPALAHALATRLARRGVNAQVLTAPLPRRDYLAHVTAARIAITLPDQAEGCYLPALEAMAAGCAVICPDALGNRAFCRDGDTCLSPTPTVDGLADAALLLLAHPDHAARLAATGRAEAGRHGLASERAAFTTLLRRLAAPPEADGGPNRDHHLRASNGLR